LSVLLRVQELTAPEEKVERVKVSDVVASGKRWAILTQ